MRLLNALLPFLFPKVIFLLFRLLWECIYWANAHLLFPPKNSVSMLLYKMFIEHFQLEM